MTNTSSQPEGPAVAGSDLGSVSANTDPVVRRWRARTAALLDGHELERWPDRAAATAVADRLFAEFGRMPDGEVAEDDLVLGNDPRVRVRAYRPGPACRARSPALLLLHGGGYAFGSIDERENVAMARSRALATGALVFAAEYRLAPEAPFPAAFDDVVSVLKALLDDADVLGVDRRRVVIDAVSSGAGLAAAAAVHSAATRRPPLAGLVLEIPSLDLRPEAPWLNEYAAASGVTDRARVRDYYLRGHDPADPRVSPVVGDLSALPPTHVLSAEQDPLREVAEEFVRRLRSCGVSVSATRHLGAVHGSHNLTGASRDARIWEAEVNAVLGDFFDAAAAGVSR